MKTNNFWYPEKYLARKVTEILAMTINKLDPKNDFGKAGLVPDDRMVVDDPEVQKLLDWCQAEYEKAHGKPKPNGLWLHQLSPEEQRRLSKEEKVARMVPWQLTLWTAILDNAIEDGDFSHLPAGIAKAALDAFGCETAKDVQSLRVQSRYPA